MSSTFIYNDAVAMGFETYLPVVIGTAALASIPST
jgi:hypothetical protein